MPAYNKYNIFVRKKIENFLLLNIVQYFNEEKSIIKSISSSI